MSLFYCVRGPKWQQGTAEISRFEVRAGRVNLPLPAQAFTGARLGSCALSRFTTGTEFQGGSHCDLETNNNSKRCQRQRKKEEEEETNPGTGGEKPAHRDFSFGNRKNIQRWNMD